MKLSSLKVDADSIEQGAWVGNIPELGEIRFKVRGVNNSDFRKLQSKLIEAVPRQKRVGGRLDPDEQDRITSTCLLQTVLLDWEGITDENDQPIPYSKEMAREFLTSPAYRRVRDGVIWASSTVGEEISDAQEEDAKNSEASSAGNSAGAPNPTTSNG